MEHRATSHEWLAPGAVASRQVARGTPPPLVYENNGLAATLTPKSLSYKGL
jgi:hypothetical protein